MSEYAPTILGIDQARATLESQRRAICEMTKVITGGESR